MHNKRPDYISYLLRLWRNGDNASSQTKHKRATTWRASLQRPQNGRRIGFLCLEYLFDFLRKQTGEEDRDKGDSDGGGL